MKPLLLAAIMAAALAVPALANDVETAALYHACGELERDRGEHERAAVFKRAADVTAGGWRAPRRERPPQLTTCLSLYPMALHAERRCAPHSTVCSPNVPNAIERSYPRG